METMNINGEEYVLKKDIKNISAKAEKVDGLEYVVIRTYSAGVHAGYLKRREGKEVELVNSRRIWKWKGANELCGLAMHGILYPEESNISPIQSKIILTEAIEILEVSEKAKKTIEDTPEWLVK